MKTAKTLIDIIHVRVDGSRHWSCRHPNTIERVIRGGRVAYGKAYATVIPHHHDGSPTIEVGCPKDGLRMLAPH